MTHRLSLDHALRCRFGVRDHGWSAFEVAGLHGVEGISTPFRYEIALTRPADAGLVALDELLNQPATLTIGESRGIHGVIGEATLCERAPSLLVYRVALVPFWWRARFDQRCRRFVDKSLREIVTSLLERRLGAYHPLVGAAPQREAGETFVAPRGMYRWAVAWPERIEDPKLRSYVVQYNESDFDFVARLLEEEGISYVFEHDTDSVMTLTDRPGRTALAHAPRRYRMKTSSLGDGGDPEREVITALSSRSALGPGAVVMRDFDWHRSRTVLEGRADVTVSQPFIAEHFEFPGRDEAVLAGPCVSPATFRLDRLEVERRLAAGRGQLPSATAGSIFTLVDDGGQREEGELLLTALETTVVGSSGSELAWQILGLGSEGRAPPKPGLQTQFEVLPASIVYRPAMRTPRPRVGGLHTALVTAEEADVDAPLEIHADPHGRVRLRFPWDTTAQDGTPSSDWVRVAQAWAGSGFGALYVPRVGHEVLVAYEQGDPDRPIVVGSVYNAQAPPPYDPQRQPTVSTLRSETSPGGGGYNELRFEDRAGHEEVFLHAQRSLREVVGVSHSTRVGASQTISVGAGQSVSIGAGQSVSIGAGQSVSIGAGQSEDVGAGRERTVGASERVRIADGQTLCIGACRHVTVGDADDLVVERGDRTVETTLGKQVFRAPAGKIVLEAGTARLEMESGRISLDNGAGATLDMIADLISIDTGSGSRLQLFSNGAYLKASLVSVEGDVVTDIKGGIVKLNC